jgi:hypothetical protein
MTIELTPWIVFLLIAGIVAVCIVGYVAIRTAWTREWFTFGFGNDDEE